MKTSPESIPAVFFIGLLILAEKLTLNKRVGNNRFGTDICMQSSHKGQSSWCSQVLQIL
jgi:hypothetical protein